MPYLSFLAKTSQTLFLLTPNSQFAKSLIFIYPYPSRHLKSIFNYLVGNQLLYFCVPMENQKGLEAYYIQQQSSKHGQTSQHSSQMNIETDINLTKKKRIIFWVYLFTILAFFITITILSVYSYMPTKAFTSTDNYYYANQVATDWKTGFIIDFQVLNGSVSSCPANYESAVNFDWSGTTYGCYCKISSNMNFVLSGYCSPGLIQKSCSNMKTQSSFTSHNWVNSGLLCLKRSVVSFANEQKYDGTNKICGSSQSLVIVPTAQPCPYVNISFSQFALEDHQTLVTGSTTFLKATYASYNSTSPYSFYSYPITKFTVSEDQFCQMDLDTGLTTDHSDFVLLNYARGCAKEGNYTLLDTMSEISFYQYNQNLQSLTLLPGFPQPGNWVYKLGFASLTGWTYKCRHTFSNKFSIPNAIDQFNFVYLGTFSNFLIGIAVALVVIILEIAIITLRRIINNAVYPIGYKQKYLLKHFLLALSRYIIDICAKLVIFGLTLANLFTIYTNYNWFKSAVNLNCPDGNIATLQVIMNPYMELYTKLFNYCLATLVICIAMIIIDIIHFIYIYHSELAFYLVGTEDKQMVKKQEDEELKWVDQKKELFDGKQEQMNIQKEETDQFRITMAQNIFSREESDPLPQKLKKKKKKKFSPFKRKDEQQEGIKDEGTVKKDQADSLDFNPFLLEDESIAKLDSPEYDSIKKPKNPKRRK